MPLRALIIDFDQTITTQDLMFLYAALVGKQKETEELERLFVAGKSKGLSGLITRFNFLSGVTMDQITAVFKDNDYLRPGARELFAYLKSRGIVSIIASGNLVPVLEIYQQKLGADYVVGSRPKMTSNRIDSISEADYSGLDFKVRDSRAILEKMMES